MACKTWDSLPDILVAQDISDFLILSRRRVYELFNIPTSEGGIPNFEVGNSKRVDKSDFEKWIQKKKEEKSKKVS